jgi:hypothetical protein
MKHGAHMEMADFKAEVNALGRTPRPLTQQEQDELDE